jgi:hypothetical protein
MHLGLKETGPLCSKHHSGEPCRLAKAPDGPRFWHLMSSGSKKKEPRYACLIEAKASHRWRMWAEVISSASHFLRSGGACAGYYGRYPAYYTLGTVSLPGVESGRGVTLTPHTLLVPRSKSRVAIPVLSLRAFVACKKGENYLPLNPSSFSTYPQA